MLVEFQHRLVVNERYTEIIQKLYIGSRINLINSALFLAVIASINKKIRKYNDSQSHKKNESRPGLGIIAGKKALVANQKCVSRFAVGVMDMISYKQRCK